MYDLDVPDYSKAPLILSGVSITSASAAASLTLTPQAPLRDIFATPMTASREFASGDALAVYAEVYENVRTRVAHVIDVRVALQSDDGRVVQTVSDERSSAVLAAPGGQGFLTQIPLDVDPGIYVIHVEARSSLTDQPPVSRDIQIRVK
jgi:hypothetical protein